MYKLPNQLARSKKLKSFRNEKLIIHIMRTSGENQLKYFFQAGIKIDYGNKE